MSVKVTGIATTRRALLAVGRDAEKIASREVVRSALNVQSGAKRGTPVDTGRLRNSIAVAESEESLPDGSGSGPGQVRPGMLKAVIGTNVSYAIHVHFGARGVPAKPFLFNAFEEEWPRFVGALKAKLGDSFVRSSR